MSNKKSKKKSPHKNKKKSRNKITPSASIEPSSESHGKIEDNSREETEFNSKIEKTLDVEQQQQMPKSIDSDSNTSESTVFDSENDIDNSLLLDSSFPPYDPVTNYLSPRPKFLRYNPDRYREILARQQELARFSKTASSEDEMPPLEDVSVDRSVAKTEEIVEESVVISEEHENEDEEEEFEDENRWSLNVFLQYLVVMVALILMTLAISSMNSPPLLSTEFINGYNVSEIHGETFGSMMLMAEYLNSGEIDKGYKKRDQDELTAGTEELVEMPHEQEIYFDEKVYTEWQEPVILVSKKMETYRVEAENEGYIRLLGAGDHNSSYENEESEILKPILKQMVDEDDGNKGLNENETEGKENSNSVTKVAYFDPVFAAVSAIFVLIFASTSVLYYTMQTEVSFPIGHINEAFDESSSVGSFGSRSNICSEYYESNKDACSSNQTKYFEFQQSAGDSTSHGSFTVEKKIVKKQRTKTPEAIISTVRRSSRIHNRSISSP